MPKQKFTATNGQYMGNTWAMYGQYMSNQPPGVEAVRASENREPQKYCAAMNQ